MGSPGANVAQDWQSISIGQDRSNSRRITLEGRASLSRRAAKAFFATLRSAQRDASPYLLVAAVPRCAVSRVSNLLEPRKPYAFGLSGPRPIANRRYGRLKICATLCTSPSAEGKNFGGSVKMRPLRRLSWRNLPNGNRVWSPTSLA